MIELKIPFNNAVYTVEVKDYQPEAKDDYEDIQFELIDCEIDDRDHDPDLMVAEDFEFIDLVIAAAIQYKKDNPESEY